MRGNGVKGGRLEFLVPHLLRSQILRPNFVRMSLRLGAARGMPAWAKLQFLNCGVGSADLEHVLGRVTSLEAWVGEWEKLGKQREEQAAAALAAGDTVAARVRGLAGLSAWMEGSGCDSSDRRSFAHHDTRVGRGDRCASLVLCVSCAGSGAKGRAGECIRVIGGVKETEVHASVCHVSTYRGS